MIILGNFQHLPTVLKLSFTKLSSLAHDTHMIWPFVNFLHHFHHGPDPWDHTGNWCMWMKPLPSPSSNPSGSFILLPTTLCKVLHNSKKETRLCPDTYRYPPPAGHTDKWAHNQSSEEGPLMPFGPTAISLPGCKPGDNRGWASLHTQQTHCKYALPVVLSYSR